MSPRAPSYASQFKYLNLSFPFDNVLHVVLNRLALTPVTTPTVRPDGCTPPLPQAAPERHERRVSDLRRA